MVDGTAAEAALVAAVEETGFGARPAGPVTLAVSGMMCSHCTGRVDAALKAVPGVTSVAVDLASNSAVVDGTAAEAALVAAVEETGFGARLAVPVELNVKGMTCEHCVARADKGLRAVAGVTSVAVDLAGGKATVEGTAALPALLGAIEDAGFEGSVAGAAGAGADQTDASTGSDAPALRRPPSLEMGKSPAMSRGPGSSSPLHTPLPLQSVCSPASNLTARRTRSLSCSPRGSSSRWSATASTTHPRLRGRTSASPLAPARTSPSRRPTSYAEIVPRSRRDCAVS